jgi:hypothetical protein
MTEFERRTRRFNTISALLFVLAFHVTQFMPLPHEVSKIAETAGLLLFAAIPCFAVAAASRDEKQWILHSFRFGKPGPDSYPTSLPHGLPGLFPTK